MSLAIVSLSGGIDSCVAAAIAKSAGLHLALLHADYGQLTETREHRAFEGIADHFAVPAHRRLEVPMQALRLIGGSSLTDETVPMESGLPDRGSLPNTYVPFRNAHLLATCVSWAEAIGAEHVFVGFAGGDGCAYTDCSRAFLRAFAAATEEGTAPETKISLHAPLIDKAKDEIIKIGMFLGAPLHLTWSCYRSETLACGTCASCLVRLRGFREAGLSDPITYEPQSPPKQAKKAAKK